MLKQMSTNEYNTEVVTPHGQLRQAIVAPKPTFTRQPQCDNYISNTYRQILLLMKNNPSNDGLIRLRDRLAQQPASQHAVQTIDSLKAGKPIPEPAMRALLVAVNYLDGHMYAPLSNQRGAQTKQIFAQVNSYDTSPSPFAIKPIAK